MLIFNVFYSWGVGSGKLGSWEVGEVGSLHNKCAGCHHDIRRI